MNGKVPQQLSRKTLACMWSKPDAVTASIVDSSPYTDLRRLPAKTLRASLGARASRGETSGLRVDALRAALALRRRRAFLVCEGASSEQADELAHLIGAGVDGVANTEGVTR